MTRSTVSTAWRRRAAAFGLALVAAACGGGGGDDAPARPTLESPPAVAAGLQGSAPQASAAAAAAVSSAQRVVELGATLDTSLLPLVGSSGSPLSGAQALRWAQRAHGAAPRERALATQTLGCADFFGSPNCSGTVTLDTNASGSSSVIAAGTYVAITFNGLQGVFEGAPLQLSGGLRIDYLTAFDLNAPSMAGLRFQVTLVDFAGTADGVIFAAQNEVALFEFDAQGNAQTTVDGLRLSGLETLTITDAANYTLGDVTLRRAHWEAAGHVDLHFVGWRVAGGRPAPNATVRLSVPGSAVDVTVVAVSSTTVVYAVNALINGVASAYTVTATYPAGGGAPTYTVVGAST